MTREERETIIRFDDSNELAYVSTFSDTVAKRCGKAGVEMVKACGEWRGRVDKRRISLRKRRSPKISLELRDKLRDNMAKARAAKINSGNAGKS